MRYSKTILASLLLAVFAFAQTASAYNFSIFHTLDSDFNGTPWQTTVDTGYGRVRLAVAPVNSGTGADGTLDLSLGGVAFGSSTSKNSISEKVYLGAYLGASLVSFYFL